MNLAPRLLPEYSTHGKGAAPDGTKHWAASSRGRPPATSKPERGVVAVYTMEATVGQALLLLIGLAAVLFVLILLLVETDYIVRLSKKLVHRFRFIDSDDPDESDEPDEPDRGASTPVATENGSSNVSRDDQEVS